MSIKASKGWWWARRRSKRYDEAIRRTLVCVARLAATHEQAHVPLLFKITYSLNGSGGPSHTERFYFSVER